MKQRIYLLFVLIILNVFNFSCTKSTYSAPSSSSSAISINFPPITYTLVATGFVAPLQITNAGDGSNRLFIVEKGGKIKIISNGSVLNDPFLDITGLISTGPEQGLLGIAFPPGYAGKHYFYVDYTNRIGIGNTVIARYHLTNNPDMANSSLNTTILSVTQPFRNHNGGQLLFGPDGFLYIGMGDGGSEGDPQNNGQNRKSLLGKILRVDVETGNPPYSIPGTNPFGNEIWAYGLRNPWRFSFDRFTNELYIADVGGDRREEINVQAPGRAGENYGWKIMEGSECFNNTNCDQSGLVLPVAEYSHVTGDCSVIGGHVYRGAQFPALQGTYLYGDLCSGRIRGLKKNGTTWMTKVLLDTPFQISSFGEDEAGNIYFAEFATGAIYKIIVP